jgi:hypothetical protein
MTRFKRSDWGGFMRWYSALMCSVPIMMAALGPNLNMFNSQDVIENLKSQTIVASLNGEFRSLSQAPETIIIPEQDNLSPEDEVNENFTLNRLEFSANLHANESVESHLAWDENN